MNEKGGLVVGLLFFAILLLPFSVSARQLDTTLIKAEGICKKIIDGWTLEVQVKNKTLKVTFLGMISPKKTIPKFQTRYLNKTSWRYLNEVICGERLLFEISKEANEDGVHPAYVRTLDGAYLNVEIIKKGYARYNEKDEYKIKERLKKAQEYAEKTGLGLWDLRKGG